MKLTIDRFEEDFVVCEVFDTQEFINIKKSLFPENIKEGDIVIYENDVITIDTSETTNVSERIKSKMDSLWE